ncbi:hypothetical protein EMCRGX_G017207 [Ephydatia muelleri]
MNIFRTLLIGRHFTLETDHCSLVWLDKLKDSNSHLTRWSLALQPYNFTVVHPSGSANGNANCLLRTPWTVGTANMFAAGEGRSVADWHPLEKGVRCGKDGKTALDIAVLQGHSEIIEVLKTSQSKAVATQLLSAAHDGDIATVRRLVTEGRVDMNVMDENGKTALDIAVNNGHSEIIEVLNKAAVATLLLSAACDRDIATVRRLLTEGHVDVNITDQNGRSPLYTSSCNGHLDVVKALIKAGADINQADKNGKTALDIAVETGYREIIEVLKNSQSKAATTQLLSAARNGDIATVRRLVTEGHVDVNITDEDGRSPLYASSSRGHLEIVKTLIEVGANINQVNKNGVSPLYVSIFNGRLDIVKTLIKAGANINQIKKELVMVVAKAVMEKELVKPAAVEKLVVVMEVKEDVLTAVEEAVDFMVTVKEVDVVLEDAEMDDAEEVEQEIEEETEDEVDAGEADTE